MLYVGRHADDLAPAVGASIADALADRVFVREVAARRRLADDDDFGRILVVAFVELAPGVALPDDAHNGVGRAAEPRNSPLSRLDRRPASEHKPGVVNLAGERASGNYSLRSHAGHRLHAF